MDIDRRGLQNKYKNIKSIIETSCKSASGIDNLQTIIENEIGILEHIHNKLLTTWFNVKSKLENMKKDFIPFEEYRNICETENITEDISQQTLL